MGSLGLCKAPQGVPSPTAPLPWVPPAPQLPSCLSLPRLAPKGHAGVLSPRQDQAGSGKPQHPGREQPFPAQLGPVPQFPSIAGGGQLTGVGVRLPTSLQPSPSQLYWERTALLGEQSPGSTRRAHGHKKRGLFLAWFLRKWDCSNGSVCLSAALFFLPLQGAQLWGNEVPPMGALVLQHGRVSVGRWWRGAMARGLSCPHSGAGGSALGHPGWAPSPCGVSWTLWTSNIQS